jgi:hypothetical protein
MMKRAGIALLALAFTGLVWAVDPPTTQPAAAPAAASLFAHRTPHLPPKPGEMRTFTVKELGNFDYDPEKGGPVPPDVQALSGMKVRISGFMMPLEQSEVITEFALVPSLTSCCFGQPPGVQHIITVHCPKTRPAPFTIDPIIVEGTLKVSVQREDNYTVNIFEICDATAKPIPLNLSKDVLQGAANYVPKGDVKN